MNPSSGRNSSDEYALAWPLQAALAVGGGWNLPARLCSFSLVPTAFRLGGSALVVAESCLFSVGFVGLGLRSGQIRRRAFLGSTSVFTNTAEPRPQLLA
jgi:hypothetical protein